MPGGVRRPLVVLFVVLLAGGALAPAVAAGGSPPGVTGDRADGNGRLYAAAETPAENETIRHENPEQADAEGNLADTKSWLASRLSERLGSSVLQISQGQYEQARGLLGNETRSLLARYVDVAGETETEADDRTAETLNETVETQRNFTEQARTYTRLYQKYLQARNAGNLTRARELARRLLDLGRRLNRTGHQLVQSYRNVSESTGANVQQEVRTIQRTTENVSQQRAEIRAAIFVETRMTARALDRTVSPRNPLRIRGRVVDENGTAIPNATVAVLEAGRLAARTTTNATGAYVLRYRPVLLPADADTVTVRYLPEGGSRYLGTNATVNVSVRQVTPRLELEGVPDRVGFNDSIAVEARLTVDGRPVGGVPLVASLGGVTMGRAITGNDSALLAGRVPATVEDGQRTVRVSLAIEGRALAATTANRSVTVLETPTRLELAAERVNGSRLHVTGRLTTRDGTPLAGRSVDIAIGGRDVGGDLTNAAGEIDVVLSIPEGVALAEGGNLSVRVVGSFAAPNSNLGPSRARARVMLPPGGGAGILGFGVPDWAWVALLGLVAVVGVGTYAVLSRREREPGSGASAGADESGGTDTGKAGGDAATPGGDPLVALARDHLDRGATDDAVQAGYEAVRTRLAARLNVTEGTHWEFYRACRDAGLPAEHAERLQRLTEYYERAAFAPASLSVESAREALGLVETVEDERPGASADD